MNEIPIIEVVTRNDIEKLQADRSHKGRLALLDARTKRTQQRRKEFRFVCPWHTPRADTRGMSLVNVERVFHVLRRVRAQIQFFSDGIKVDIPALDIYWMGVDIGSLYDFLRAHKELAPVMLEIDSETRLGAKVKGRPLWK